MSFLFRAERQWRGVAYGQVRRIQHDRVLQDCENGTHRPPQKRGFVYWTLFFCTAGLLAAVHSLMSKRRLVGPS